MTTPLPIQRRYMSVFEFSFMHKIFILCSCIIVYIVIMKFIVFCTDCGFIVQLVDRQLECRGSMATSGAVVLNKLSGMCVLVAVSVYSDKHY